MNATRAATKKELLRTAGRRLNEMMKLGTTTVEIKSGYGLSADAETKMLDVMHDLRRGPLHDRGPDFSWCACLPA